MVFDVVRFLPSDPLCALSFGFERIVPLSSLRGIEGNSSKNRGYVESGKYLILLDPHQDVTKDFLHHRNCGFNHIVAKLAAERKVTFGFSLKYLQTPQQIGRVLQAISLCRKYGVPVILCSGATSVSELRSAHDLFAFGRILGISSQPFFSQAQLL